MRFPSVVAPALIVFWLEFAYENTAWLSAALIHGPTAEPSHQFGSVVFQAAEAGACNHV